MRPLTRPQILPSLCRQSFHTPRRRILASPILRQPFHTSPRRKQDHDAPSQPQEVKIVKPTFAWRRLALLAGYAGASYFLSQYFFGRLVDKLGIEEGDLEEFAEEDDDTESWFIAFQHPKKLPATFYKQSDPEWQEFIKMSNSEERKDAVKDELAQRVTHDISAHPRMQMRLGNDIELTKYWLELKYPDSPPPEYARQGVEIATDYVAWSTQVIPHTHYAQLSHILYPVAVFTAATHSLRIFFRLQVIKVKKLVGLSLNQMDKQVQAVSRLEHTQRDMASHQEKLDSQRDAAAGDTNQLSRQFADPQNQHPTQQQQPGRDRRAIQPSPQATTSTSTSLPSGAILPAAAQLPPDLAIAFKMFVSSLVHAWFSGRVDAEARGTFLVIGQVEVTGDKGKVKCDVKAAYDPKTSSYLYVKTTVKHFWELRQSAKGGP